MTTTTNDELIALLTSSVRNATNHERDIRAIEGPSGASRPTVERTLDTMRQNLGRFYQLQNDCIAELHRRLAMTPEQRSTEVRRAEHEAFSDALQADLERTREQRRVTR